MTRIKEKYFVLVLLGMMSLMSIFRITRIVNTTFSTSGATDFLSYWYSGHFIRQGIDPFEAYLENRELVFPVEYINGTTMHSLPVDQEGLARVPANMALLLLLLSPFALLTWQTAKVSRMGFNLILLFFTPMLVIRLYPVNTILSKQKTIIIFLALWGLLATSNAIGNGQTTLLVFVCSLAALLTEKRYWFISGVALGLALSKYSLSLPFLVFILLFRKNYKVVAVAVILQIVGFIALSMHTITPLITMIREYSTISVMHLNLPGIHLLSAVSHRFLAYSLIFMLIILLVCSFFSMYNSTASKIDKTTRNHIPCCTGSSASQLNEIFHVHALNLLNFLTLLSFYHREYDALTAILYIALIIIGLTNSYWKLSQIGRCAIIFSTMLIMLALRRPGASASRFLPPSFNLIGSLFLTDAITSFALLIGMCINIWLTFKINDTERSAGPGAQEVRSDIPASAHLRQDSSNTMNIWG
jgi:hypothetical protein